MNNDPIPELPLSPTGDTASRMLQVLSVGQLTRLIRGVIEAEDLFSEVWVRGEVSNVTRHASGHLYFCLKDEAAVLRCVMWNGARSGRFRMEEGMRVLVCGRVTVYEKGGQYQLVATEITPDGIGELYVAFEQLKARLAEEGLFDEGRKRAIPAFPRTIAIVTSRTAAALRDMVTVARRRMPSVNLLLIPTLMQGDGSEESIVESLRRAEAIAEVDVIVIGRGGGSIEDLWSFNTESVTRAISACAKPVVSAVGHETDYTLADMVADLRAPTPSASMELIVPAREQVAARIGHALNLASASVSALVAGKRNDFDRLRAAPVLSHPERWIQDRWQALDAGEIRLRASFERVVSASGARFGELAGKLDGLSPLAVLARGYAVIRRADGTVIRRAADARPGETVETLLADGAIVSQVNDIRKGWD